MWDAFRESRDTEGRPVATLVSVVSEDERHTKGRTRKRHERLGKWQRLLLLEAVEPTRLAEGKVKWSALVGRQAPNTTKLARDRQIATSLGSALNSLESAGFVRVTPPRSAVEDRRRVVTSYALTARGLRRAEELVEHGGVTEATVKRRQRRVKWTDPEVQLAVDEANRQRTEAENHLLTVNLGLMARLERRFGYPPEIGGGDDVEEAAKLYLLLARARLDQTLAPQAVQLRQAVEAARVWAEDMREKSGLTPEAWNALRQVIDALPDVVKQMARLQEDALDEDLE